MAVKKLCSRVYWHRNQWQYKPARSLHNNCRKLNLSTSWIPLGTSDTNAYKRLGELLERLQAPVRNAGMVIIFNRYEEDIMPQKAKRTQQDKMQHLKFLRKAFGKLEPNQVTTADCQRYVDARGKSSPHQANQEASTLSQCFRYAKVWGLHNGENPVSGIIRHRIQSRERLPSIEVDLYAFKLHASEFCKAWVDFKLETGLRQGDILSIKPQEHFFDDGIRVTLSKSKRKKISKRIFIAWTPKLKNIVTKLMSINKVQGDYMVCSRNGEKISKSTFESRWQSSMNKALNATIDPLNERFTEHDIRATHATIVDDVVGEEIASIQLGHDDRKTTKGYIRSKKRIEVTALSSLLNTNNVPQPVEH